LSFQVNELTPRVIIGACRSYTPAVRATLPDDFYNGEQEIRT